MSRSDPIRERYFHAVESVQRASDYFFYIGAVLSVLVLVIEKVEHPIAYDVLLTIFALDVLALFIASMASRLYFNPRAADERNRDFLTNACDVKLTHEQTDGYYNNDASEPLRRVAAQVLENTFFSKRIALRMAKAERIRNGIYIAIWLVCVLFRRTDLGVIVACAQAVFSEQIISKWLRLEWLRARSERVYDNVYRLFRANPKKSEFNAMALEEYVLYETAKANAAITLSGKIFNEMNPTLSEEWASIQKTLSIAQHKASSPTRMPAT